MRLLADISGKVLRLERQRSSKINDCHYTESGLLTACQHTVKLQASPAEFRGGVLSLSRTFGNEKCLEVTNSRKFHAIIQA